MGLVHASSWSVMTVRLCFTYDDFLCSSYCNLLFASDLLSYLCTMFGTEQSTVLKQFHEFDKMTFCFSKLTSAFPSLFLLLFLTFLLVLLTRSRQKPICPSCHGRTPPFTLKCSWRSVSPSQSRQAQLRVSSLFRSWICGSSTLILPLVDAITSTASPKRGHGSPLDGVALKGATG